MFKYLVKSKYNLITADDNLASWVRTQNKRFRSKIERLPDEEHKKILDFIADNTEVKGNTPNRFFLLHRGMSLEEFYSHFKATKEPPLYKENKVKEKVSVNYRTKMSWSLDESIASGFARAKSIYDPDPGVLVSSWIPEKDVVFFVQSKYGDRGSPKEYHLAHYGDKEKEVIIDKLNAKIDVEYKRGKDFKDIFKRSLP